MIRGRGRLSAPVAAILLIATFGTSSEGKECPGPNKVPHKDGTYDFTYESWVKPQPNRDHYDFGRCVQNNLQDRSMFVDWKRTKVKGFAKPNDLVDAGVESPSKDFDLLDTTLWYGAAPAPINNAQYREVKQGAKPQQTSVRSWVRMAVPTDATNAEKTLVSIDAIFISDVLTLPDGHFLYRYLWRDLLAGTRKPVPFVWRSAPVLQAVKAFGEVPEVLPLASTMTGVFIIDPAPPAYGVAVVEFRDDQRRVVGSAPAALYYPSGSRP